jgi:hypothetical protein
MLLGNNRKEFAEYAIIRNTLASIRLLLSSVNGIENTVESDFVSINSYRKIIFIDREFSVISINIDPFFFKNMNSESVVFCFVQKLIDDVSAG